MKREQREKEYRLIVEKRQISRKSSKINNDTLAEAKLKSRYERPLGAVVYVLSLESCEVLGFVSTRYVRANTAHVAPVRL